MRMLYDDGNPLVFEDCLIIGLWKRFFSTSDNPRCRTTAVSNYANGTGPCHHESLGAVRGFTVCNTDPLNLFGSIFSLFSLGNRHGTCRVRCKSAEAVSSNQQLSVDLSTKYSSHGWEVDADRAWARRRRPVRMSGYWRRVLGCAHREGSRHAQGE